MNSGFSLLVSEGTIRTCDLTSLYSLFVQIQVPQMTHYALSYRLDQRFLYQPYQDVTYAQFFNSKTLLLLSDL